MSSLIATDICLSYKVGQRFSLAPPWVRDRGRPRSLGAAPRKIEALKDVSFELAAGDRLGLVGPNGAGKTTLLKVLYGIFPPTGGRLEVSGRVDALFNIALGFRREATGRRNIILRGLINGWEPRVINERMDEIIRFSELGEFIDLPYKTYSQGMAARLAFSIATTLDPEILLMDEWIGAGDVYFQEKARARMDELSAKAGIVVLASHNHILLRKVCNKILHLDHGQVKSCVPVEKWDG